MARYGETDQSRELGDLAFESGTIAWTAAETAPAGWLICDGQTVARNTSLGQALAGRFGPGNGSTTYNVPDLRERFLLGKRTANEVGETGGVRNHSHGNVGLSIPGHYHLPGTLYMPDHAHSNYLYVGYHSHPYWTREMSLGGSGDYNVGLFLAGSTAGAQPGVAGGVAGAGGNIGIGNNTHWANTDEVSSGQMATAEAPYQSLLPIIKL